MQERNVWVDYAKAIGIILVVYGHVARGVFNAGLPMDEARFVLVDSIIYSFHIPLYFFLSGLFFFDSLQRAVQSQAQDREGQSPGARQGRAPVPGDQASVWLHQGALPRPGEEYVADGYAVCAIESVDGSPTFTDLCRRGAPVMRGIAAARCSQRLKHRIEPAT